MGGHVEREFKLRIPDAAAWRALLARLAGPVHEPVRQVNHFFDTAQAALRGARIGLRLRVENGRSTLTLKGPELARGGRLAARPEEELLLEPAAARAVLAGEVCPLALLAASGLGATDLVGRARALAGGAPARLLGAFENERTRVGPLVFPRGSQGPALVFEFDRTTFPGGRVELELELELVPGAEPAAVERALEELFSGVGLPVESVPSKAARFFRVLDSFPGAE